MTPSEEKQLEYARACADANAMTALADFSERVSKGEATPAEIEFMAKVADLLSEAKTRKLRDIARKGIASNSELIALL